MKFKKTLLIFSSVLIGLLLVSYVLIKMKPVPNNVNPLSRVETSKWGQVVLRNATGEMEFQKSENRWRLIRPVEDEISQPAFERILTSLTSFYVTTVISENPRNFEKFGVDGSSAIFVKVILSGHTTPVLDCSFGQKPGDISTLYCRFIGKKSVFLAYDLPLFPLRFAADEYREKQLIPAKFEDIKSIKFDDGKNPFSIYQSSHTWLVSPTQKSLDAGQLDELKNDMWSLRAQRFATPEESELAKNAPAMLKMTVEDPITGVTVAFLTKSIVEGPTKGTKYVLARSEGRTHGLVIYESDSKTMQDLVGRLFKLTK